MMTAEPVADRTSVRTFGDGDLEAGDPEVTAADEDVMIRGERLDGLTGIERPLMAAPRRRAVSR